MCLGMLRSLPHVYICMCIYTYTQLIHIYIYIYVYVHTHTPNPKARNPQTLNPIVTLNPERLADTHIYGVCMVCFIDFPRYANGRMFHRKELLSQRAAQHMEGLGFRV